MKKPSKKSVDKKADNLLADFLKQKQARQGVTPFGVKGGKGGQAMKPRMWNRKNGM
jgi:hypothetical protein